MHQNSEFFLQGKKTRRILVAAHGVGVATLLLALLAAGAGAEADADTEADSSTSPSPTASSSPPALPPSSPPPTTSDVPEPTCMLATKFLGLTPMRLPEFNASVSALCYYYNPFVNESREGMPPRWRLNVIRKNFVLLPPPPPPNASADGLQESWGPEEALVPRELRKWRECIAAATRCCAQVLRPAAPPRHGLCPSVWDSWNCWDETPAGVTAQGSCPSYITPADNIPKCYVWSSRTCRADGRWDSSSDYSTCTDLDVRRRRILELVAAYGVSMVCLVPALAVLFLLYRQLHGHRIMLHRNLFAALLLHAGAETLVRAVLVLPELEHSTTTRQVGQSVVDELPDVSRQNSVWCRTLVATTKYFRSSSFMWMFCEGFYLHRCLAAAFSPGGSLRVFYIIGWGLPALPTLLYAGLRASGGDDECWMQPSAYEWVVIVPNVVSLLANAVFLVYILRVLVLLKKPPEQEPTHYRRAVRATLVLVPLFGVHFLLTLFRPADCAWQRAHELLDHLLDGLQGAAVACIFCFCNGEVHELVRRAHRTLVERYQPGLRPSRGSHSFSTAQATL